MSIKNYIIVGLLLVTLLVGLYIYLIDNVAGGGLDVQLPSEIVAGEVTNFLIVASVGEGDEPIYGRFTDLTFGYRLSNDSEYIVLTPERTELPDNYKQVMTEPAAASQYEAYLFSIPAFPSDTNGQLEYYVDSTFDGQSNYSTGTRSVVAQTLVLEIQDHLDLTQTYQNEEMGFEVMYPFGWEIEVSGDYATKKSSRVQFHPSRGVVDALMTFEIYRGTISEGQDIETWYRNHYPETVITDDMRIVIDHEPSLLINTGNAFALYTKTKKEDILLATFSKEIVNRKIIASLKLNVSNFGIVSFTQDDETTGEAMWRILLPEELTQSSRYQIKSRLVENQNNALSELVPEEFSSSVLVTPEQIQAFPGDSVYFTFVLNYRDTNINPSGPRPYVYTDVGFNFSRHHVKSTRINREVQPYALASAVSVLGSKISSIQFSRTGMLTDGTLHLATFVIDDKFQYEILLEEL